MKNNQKIARDLIEFINKATSPIHTVLESEERLVGANFGELLMGDEWKLERGGKYYIKPYPTTLIAFTIGDEFFQGGFRIISSHTDTPGFKIKPNPEILVDNYIKLNTNVYGSPILNTWMDRLLSISGKVALRSKKPLTPNIKYIDFKKPILTIPNIAIHMNREINKGVALDRQKDMLPIIGQLTDGLQKDNYLLKQIAKEIDVDEKDILDFDLYIYIAEKGEIIGINEEFISAPRLDNQAMVYASVVGLINGKTNSFINVAACFDNEEIGSRTKQGADSMLLNNIMERIAMGIDKTTMYYHRMLENSFMISGDAAHGLHPNMPEKNDPTNKPIMNEGIVIKLSINQSYATDSSSIGGFQQLCEIADLPYQKFVNHSNQVGGKTLGPLISSFIPINTVDVGVSMLAMHSARELVGVNDISDCVKVFESFYSL